MYAYTRVLYFSKFVVYMWVLCFALDRWLESITKEKGIRRDPVEREERASESEGEEKETFRVHMTIFVWGTATEGGGEDRISTCKA